jgi:DNA-binding NarL/FixJ family response regulator
MRILIVEDDPLIQLGLKQTLTEHLNCELVGQASDGYTGVQAALELNPDLIIMDIGLPRLDGIAATKKIKETLPQVSVVMFTSYSAQTEVISALSSGADAYCIKGANVEQLLTAISAAKEKATYLAPQIARLVLDNLQPPAPQPDTAHLSERELEVLHLIVEGKNNLEIAEALYISPNTVKTHVRGIMNKLAVEDRVQAAVVALRTGLVS